MTGWPAMTGLPFASMRLFALIYIRRIAGTFSPTRVSSAIESVGYFFRATHQRATGRRADEQGAHHSRTLRGRSRTGRRAGLRAGAGYEAPRLPRGRRAGSD